MPMMDTIRRKAPQATNPLGRCRVGVSQYNNMSRYPKTISIIDTGINAMFTITNNVLLRKSLYHIAQTVRISVSFNL